MILKLAFYTTGLKQESAALKAFEKLGAVKVFAESPRALLLERAVSGVSLKSYFPKKEDQSIKIICEIIKKLQTLPLPTQKIFPHIEDWLEILDRPWTIPFPFLEKARKMRDYLLETSPSPVLLHGDLHHDNILKNGKSWVIIDPKGVRGDPAYEAAAFIRNPIPDLCATQNAEKIIINRINNFSKNLNFDPTRLKAWCFVQAVLAWIWALEDDSDPSSFCTLTEIFDGL